MLVIQAAKPSNFCKVPFKSTPYLCFTLGKRGWGIKRGCMQHLNPSMLSKKWMMTLLKVVSKKVLYFITLDVANRKIVSVDCEVKIAKIEASTCYHKGLVHCLLYNRGHWEPSKVPKGFSSRLPPQRCWKGRVNSLWKFESDLDRVCLKLKGRANMLLHFSQMSHCGTEKPFRQCMVQEVGVIRCRTSSRACGLVKTVPALSSIEGLLRSS